MLKVELPLSIPVLVAGLRVVAVTNISMVSVGSVIGIGGLGTWFTEGYQANKSDQIVAGIIAMLPLAIVIDLLIVLAGRLLTPWDAGRSSPLTPAGSPIVGGSDELRRKGHFVSADRRQLDRSRRAATRTMEHLEYTAMGAGASALIAVPVGLIIGHTAGAHCWWWARSRPAPTTNNVPRRVCPMISPTGTAISADAPTPIAVYSRCSMVRVASPTGPVQLSAASRYETAFSMKFTGRHPPSAVPAGVAGGRRAPRVPTA